MIKTNTNPKTTPSQKANADKGVFAGRAARWRALGVAYCGEGTGGFLPIVAAPGAPQALHDKAPPNDLMEPAAEEIEREDLAKAS